MLWGCQNILVANSHYHHAVTKVGKNELTPLALATWSFNFVLHAGGLLFGSQFRLRRVELELEVFQFKLDFHAPQSKLRQIWPSKLGRTKLKLHVAKASGV